MPIKRDKHWNELRPQIAKAAQDALARGAIILQNEIKMGFKGASNRGATPAHAGQPPHVDTGSLRRSIQVDMSNLRNTTRPSVKVGSNLKYARVHEFGGMIHAGKTLLTVPLNQKARDIRRRNISLRAIPGLFILNAKASNTSGNMILAMRDGKRKIIPMFVLKSRVRVPARPYLRPAIRRARPKILAEFQSRKLMASIRLSGVKR